MARRLGRGFPYRRPVGNHAVAPELIAPTSIASAETFSAPTLTAGTVTVAPAGIASAEVLGAAVLTAGTVSIAPTGIPSAEAVGAPFLDGDPILVPAGIPSGEAFGALTVSAGGVLVSPTGIESAEVVGQPRLTLDLLPTGVPSAEAVGSPVLAVGAVAVAPAGIATAETFGAAAVTAGAVGIAPTGVPSQEAFGTPRLTLAVLAVGIPSAGSVGSPAITVGLVVVAPTGIASGEAFGQVSITLTLDIATRPARPQQRLNVTYELICVARIPSASGPPAFLEIDAVEWKSLTWSSTLSRPQGLSATCPVSSITEEVAQRLRRPDRLPTELWLLRDGARVFAGPLMGGRRSGDTITLEASGLLAYLAYMIVVADLRFDQVDQFVIAAKLVDQWQALEYGHFGIDTADVGESGRLRDGSYVRDEIHYVGQRVQELGERLDGFDSEVDPETRKLQLWYPGKGIDRSTGAEAIVFDDRNITSPETMFSIAPGDLASEGFGTSKAAGSDVTLWSEQMNLELRATFGRVAATESFSDISEQSTLDDHVRGLVDARDQALFVPGPSMRVTTDADLSDYAEGDTVSVEMDTALGVVGAWRIRKRTVQVAETGAETVDLEFA